MRVYESICRVNELGRWPAILGQEYSSQKWRISEVGFVEAKVRGQHFDVTRMIIGFISTNWSLRTSQLTLEDFKQ